MSKNLWILTEESVHLTEIKKIVSQSSSQHNLNIEFSEASIKPVIKDNIFQHQYYLDGFDSEKVNNIFINSVGPSKTNPFVDFLVFLKEKKPDPKDLFEDCIFIIEATKTNTYDSRNTAMGQRSSKFVHLSYYYEKNQCKAIPVMYYTHQQAKNDHESVKFINKCVKNVVPNIQFWGKNIDLKGFKSLDEMINAKNIVSDSNTRLNDTPIHIKKDQKKIKISGKLSNPGSDSSSTSRSYTGRIGHDPNQGQLSIIAKTIRDLGYKEKIIITDHDLLPNVVNKQKNKFIKFANFIDFEIEDCILEKVEFEKDYFKYETHNKEKIASILAQNILTDKGCVTIFENHGGCEKSFIDLNADLANNNIEPRYIPLEKKITNKGGKIPDLVMLNPNTKVIYLYEGKTYPNINAGLKEIMRFDLFEETYLSKNYPKYTLKRGLIIEGGPLDVNPIIKFQITRDSQLNKKDEFS